MLDMRRGDCLIAWYPSPAAKRSAVGLVLHAALQGFISFARALLRGRLREVWALLRNVPQLAKTAKISHAPFRKPEAGEIPYRIAKQAAQARGDYSMAGRFHYAEQCAREARLLTELLDLPWHARNRITPNSRFRAWHTVMLEWIWRFVFARLIFGYGEKPHRALLWGLVVIITCACAYFFGAAAYPNTQDAAVNAEPLGFRTCLYFSIVTFTTLGYGDFRPKPGLFQLVAGGEAFAGAALMAVFIVCLTRRYMR
jgi:hypothetical protein